MDELASLFQQLSVYQNADPAALAAEFERLNVPEKYRDIVTKCFKGLLAWGKSGTEEAVWFFDLSNIPEAIDRQVVSLALSGLSPLKENEYTFEIDGVYHTVKKTAVLGPEDVFALAACVFSASTQ